MAAFNAGDDGRKFAEAVRLATETTVNPDVQFTLHEPSGFKDWNDQLRGEWDDDFLKIE